MIDHIRFGVADLERSATFYDALFFALGVRRMVSADAAIAYGVTARTFWIESAGTVPEAQARGGGLVGLRAVGRRAVDAAWEAGLAAGGGPVSDPTPGPEGPRHYFARLHDPDGHLIEIVAGHD